MADHDEDFDSGTLVQERTRTRKPRLYKVLIHNDDYTPMEFVVMVLKNVFHHTEPEAYHIMLAVHKRGVGVAGVFSHEVAETKTHQTVELARANEYPLQCSMEPD